MPEAGTEQTTTHETPLTRNETLAIAAFQCAAQIMTQVTPNIYSGNEWTKRIASETNEVAEFIYVHLEKLSQK